MRILIVSQYFWPEEFRINDLALDLVKRGWEVTVLTGNPNYPKGKFVKGYGFKYATEVYRGIKIYRVPIIARGNRNLTLILNYLSFILSGSIFSLFHKGKYDKVFAVNYSPITAILPAIVYCKKNKIKLSIWVQDLWPESVITSSDYKSKKLQKRLTKLVKFIYNKSDKIFVSNYGFVKSVMDKGVDRKKIYFMPNWAEDIFENKTDSIVNRKKFSIPEGFIIMFAGNLGESQDLECVIKASELTKDYNTIKWVFIGDGRKGEWLRETIIRKNLSNTVKILGRFRTEKMPDFFKQADIMLVSLKDEFIFSLTVPGKVQSYMASSKPILTMLNGAGNDLVTEAECGFVAEAGDFEKLSKNAINCSKLSKQELNHLGVNGLLYYQKNFSKQKIIDNFINEI